MYEDDESVDCELCAPTDDTDPYPHAHCCQCGDTGYGDVPECTCE
ncbi:hypothetical protein AB0K47_00990 [Streptomyces tirandamycinicus]|nr:hypothetical protein [Streptomyces sp. ICN441]